LEAGPGSVIVGDAHSALIRDRIPSAALRRLGPEGYVLKTVPVAGGTAIVIAAQTGRGTVYGAFHLLRLLQMQMPVSSLNIEEKPASPLRLIDHWDNVDRDRDTNGNLIGSSCPAS
jgi:alpha-glucuronidase